MSRERARRDWIEQENRSHERVRRRRTRHDFLTAIILIQKPFRVFRVFRGSLSTSLQFVIQPRKSRKARNYKSQYKYKEILSRKKALQNLFFLFYKALLAFRR